MDTTVEKTASLPRLVITTPAKVGATAHLTRCAISSGGHALNFSGNWSLYRVSERAVAGSTAEYPLFRSRGPRREAPPGANALAIALNDLHRRAPRHRRRFAARRFVGETERAGSRFLAVADSQHGSIDAHNSSQRGTVRAALM